MDTSKNTSSRGKTRRNFLKQTAGTLAGGLALQGSHLSAASSGVTIMVQPELKDSPVSWAAQELQGALRARGVACAIQSGVPQETSARDRVLVARSDSPLARPILERADVQAPDVAESVALVKSKNELLTCSSDLRGLVYGLLELADRVTHAGDPLLALRAVDTVVQKPAVPIRSITRLFTSDLEDKPWFYDKNFWQRYLTELARDRFNRFSLALGIGYNSPRNVPDSYFYFAYPFLISVPGYNVKARGLPDEERDRNFAMLKWISEETAARGLHFQLAIWTQAYEFTDSPNVNYPIDGLTHENHAAYCRDAIRQLLQALPSVGGVTLRAHSESGIPENSYNFWQRLLEGIAGCGRKVEVDFHSKGIEHKLIDMALGTGLPVKVSPKYWAEHMGLPYHQAAIRELERATTGGRIEQQRRFTRYGYADYLREDRKYGVYYRMWPGTQRLLLWGDPAMASGYGRSSTFSGSLGLELMEPLSFKGRMGSGTSGGRNPYADPALQPGGDWEKYLYSYRVWGRLLYDPNENPDAWRRFLKTEYGNAARECEEALANASRILPLITVAHHPSASNNRYWPELYTDMPIVNTEGHSYNDTPSPKRFGTVSPLDPALFSTVEEFAQELVAGKHTGKYSPLEVARWLEGLARSADGHVAQAQKQIAKADDPAFRRLAVDVKVQAGIGHFFAEKFRAAVAFALYNQTGDRVALEKALKHYRAAIDAWKKVVKETSGVYKKDVTFGREPHLRGHWADRVAAMEADFQDMEKTLQKEPSRGAEDVESPSKSTGEFLSALAVDAPARHARLTHTPPASLRRGQPFSVELALASGEKPVAVRLHYRHVNQQEAYEVAEMKADGNRHRFEIAGSYTDSRYPLQYFFEIAESDGTAWLYPGFTVDLSNQPYFIVRSASRMLSTS